MAACKNSCVAVAKYREVVGSVISSLSMSYNGCYKKARIEMQAKNPIKGLIGSSDFSSGTSPQASAYTLHSNGWRCTNSYRPKLLNLFVRPILVLTSTTSLSLTSWVLLAYLALPIDPQT